MKLNFIQKNMVLLPIPYLIKWWNLQRLQGHVISIIWNNEHNNCEFELCFVTSWVGMYGLLHQIPRQLLTSI